MADPVMKPFTKDIRRQFEDRWSSIHDRLGLTLDDMQGARRRRGDRADRSAPGKAALAIVVDVTGKLPQAHELLEKVNEDPVGAGRQAERGEGRGLPGHGHPVRPARAGGGEGSGPQHACKGARIADRRPRPKGDDRSRGNRRAEKPAARQAFYCLTGNLLVVTDNLEIMKGILGPGAGHQQERTAWPTTSRSRSVMRALQEGLRRRRRRRCAGSCIRWAMPRPPAPPRPSTNAARERPSSK